MLIRYYITLIIIATVMALIGHGSWALIPGLLLLTMLIGSIQSNTMNINSIQQLATDNIMLLSWIILMIGVSWLMFLGGYDLYISMIIISLVTIGLYCIALITNYEDGAIVWHQSSIISWSLVVIYGITLIVQYRGNGQELLGILSIYFVLIASILGSYSIFSRIFKLPLPSSLRDELLLLGIYIIPIAIIFTILYNAIMRACMIILILYLIYGYGLRFLSYYHRPIPNHAEVTLDLILKGYKTSQIDSRNPWSWVNQIFDYIRQISHLIELIIQRIPDIVMLVAYGYFIFYLIQGRLLISDLIAYIIALGLYISLAYVYQRDMFRMDTTAQSFVFGYLTVLAFMITIFSSDPISGSLIGTLRVIINAIVVTQYHRLQLGQYVQARHVQRRIGANTVSALIIIFIILQLPIDIFVIIPTTLIVTAVLGFMLAQSYSTLRTLK